jgi:acyl-CoA-dependent ceramide synthase
VGTKCHVCHFYWVLDVSVLLMSRCHLTICALTRYFRHYLNLVMLYSVYKDFDLIPCVSLLLICAVACLTAAYRQSARSWSPSKGVWMVGWMKWQIFAPLLLLQFLNLFWYFLILRILWR